MQQYIYQCATKWCSMAVGVMTKVVLLEPRGEVGSQLLLRPLTCVSYALIEEMRSLVAVQTFAGKGDVRSEPRDELYCGNTLAQHPPHGQRHKLIAGEKIEPTLQEKGIHALQVNKEVDVCDEGMLCHVTLSQPALNQLRNSGLGLSPLDLSASRRSASV